jgi:16S rRNA (uracil1498-N3)-methyltransferase
MDGGKPFLLDELDAGQDALVLVGPEGDFSIDEVRLAQAHGFRSVSLGRSRLRTETAALVAVHLMHIRHARM